MSDYHILKEDDGWKVKRAGADRAAGVYETKADAIKAAEGFIERSGGGERREHASRDGSVHKKGQIIDSDTIGKTDPKGNG
ncbi:MAG: DUF2188 domain-containing protein [Litorimonas sp.]